MTHVWWYLVSGACLVVFGACLVVSDACLVVVRFSDPLPDPLLDLTSIRSQAGNLSRPRVTPWHQTRMGNGSHNSEYDQIAKLATILTHQAEWHRRTRMLREKDEIRVVLAIKYWILLSLLNNIYRSKLGHLCTNTIDSIECTRCNALCLVRELNLESRCNWCSDAD